MKALIALEERAEERFLELNTTVDGPLSCFGVDGKQLSAWSYFVKGVSGRRWPLTPGEVGCSLAHLDALRSFLNSSDSYLTVYEFDAFVRDEFVELDPMFTPYQGQPVVLHLGGQEGLMKRTRLFGKVVLTTPSAQVWRLARHSTRWLYRTCGDVVNREAAQIIARSYQRRLQRADDWGQLLSGHRCVFLFAPMVSHPLELSRSRLEHERRQLFKPSLLRRVLIRCRGLLTLAMLKGSGHQRLP